MSTERKVPRRRFKEFQNDKEWEQFKIGEVGSFYYGYSCPKWSVTENAITPCIRYGELYTKFGTKIERVFSRTNISPDKLRFSKGNEVLIPRVGEDPMDYNHCTWLSIPGVAIGEMISVYNTEQNPLFTATMFNATLQEEFAIRVEGGSVTNLYYEKLKNIEVSFPSIAEQEKIATYFEQIDKLINLNQHKLEKLKALKKAYLTQMFPAEGECKPKLRFAGFNGEWEKCMLGDLGNIITGSTPSTEDKSNYGQDYLFVSPVDIDDNRYVENTITKLSNKGFELGRNVKAGSTLFVSIGSTIGKVAQIKQNVVTNQQINAIETNEKYDADFIYSLMCHNAKNIRKLAATQAVPIINKTTFSQVEILVSSNISEQKKIGEFFKELDNTIDLHQRKLQKLQNLKKAYLNEMFV